MLTFTEKRQKFLKNLRATVAANNSTKPSQTHFVPSDDTDDEIMALLEKKFDELFGALDDDS